MSKQPMERQLADALEGDDGESVRTIATQLGRKARKPQIVGAACRALFLARFYDLAVQVAQIGCDRFPENDKLVRLRYALLKRLRFELEATSALHDVLAHKDDARAHEAAAIHHMEQREYDSALEHIAAAAAARPEATHFHQMRLECIIEQGRRNDAGAAARASESTDPSLTSTIVEALWKGGMVDEALRLEGPRSSALEAQFLLFRGDIAAAKAAATAAIEGDDDPQPAWSALLGALVLGRELEAAQRLIQDAGGPRDVTWSTWHAELLIRRGDHAAAEQVLSRVLDQVPNYLAAGLLMVQNRIEHTPVQRFRHTSHEGLFEGQIQATGTSLAFEGGFATRHAVERAVEEALHALGGNRTPWPTIVNEARTLASVGVPSSARHRARAVQHLAATKGFQVARREVQKVIAELGPRPVMRCYLGELDLWEANFEAALSTFSDICARHPETTWGWIGKGAAQMFLGNPANALDTFDQGFVVLGRRGASLPAHRGEALYLLDRMDEAAEELSEACEAHPSRAGAWLVRLLAAEAMGDGDTSDACARHLSRYAAPLLSDGAAVAGIQPWWPERIPQPDRVALAKSALRLMRGNRSSSCALWFAPHTNVVRRLIPKPIFTHRWEADERLAICSALRRA